MFFVPSCSCLCPIHWSQVLSREWRCSWSSADRRNSNQICVIKNVIAYLGAIYITGLTVYPPPPRRNRCVFVATWFYHDDVPKWKHVPRYWPFVWGIHRSPVSSPHKGQWRGALMFSLIWSWTKGCANNRNASDLRHHCVHYCPASRTTLVATRFRVAAICPIIQVPHCIRVFFYFVSFVFINHIFHFYYELYTYCNILDIYLS